MTARESFSILFNCLLIIFHISFSFPSASCTMSLNIDMKTNLSWKSGGSHCNSPIVFLNLLENTRCLESCENLPLELHRLSINSMQFAEEVCLWIPLNLFLLGSNRIVSYSPQAQHRVGKDVELGIGVLICSTVQQTRRYTPWILGVNQVYTSSLCLTTDQLFHIPEKLSCSSPRRILSISQIHVMVISEMNCYFESGIHKHSPYGHNHVQILHKIAWTFVDFPDHVVDGVHDDGVNKAQTWATVCVCIYQGRQSKDNDTNWQPKERLRKRRIFNAWRPMHWHQLRSHSHVHQVFQVTSHIVGFRSVRCVVNLNSCRCNHVLHFDLYANSLLRFTLRKRDFWGVVFTVNWAKPVQEADKSLDPSMFQLSSMRRSCLTSKFVLLVLDTSMYFSGIGNDSPLGE